MLTIHDWYRLCVNNVSTYTSISHGVADIKKRDRPRVEAVSLFFVVKVGAFNYFLKYLLYRPSKPFP